jgi:hypothetical protein
MKLNFLMQWMITLSGAAVLLIWGWILLWWDRRSRRRPH